MRTSGLSVISLALGILGMCLSCLVIGIVPSIIALILGIIALTDDLAYKWPSICGIACSAIGIVFFAAIMLEAINGSGSGTKIPEPKDVVSHVAQENSSSQYNQQNNSVEQSQNITSQTIEEPKIETEEYFTIGQTAELNNVQVTMANYYESYGSEFNKPATGKVFVLVEFEISNNSSEDIAVSSIMSFSAYADDYALDYSMGAMLENQNSTQLDGTIAAGKKMKGCVGYEVPENWQNIEIHFIADYWTGNKFKFGIDK